MNLLGLLRGSNLSRSDSPDGLVGDDDVVPLVCGDLSEEGLELRLNDIVGLAGLSLLQLFSYTSDDSDSRVKSEQ